MQSLRHEKGRQSVSVARAGLKMKVRIKKIAGVGCLAFMCVLSAEGMGSDRVSRNLKVLGLNPASTTDFLCSTKGISKFTAIKSYSHDLVAYWLFLTSN